MTSPAGLLRPLRTGNTGSRLPLFRASGCYHGRMRRRKSRPGGAIVARYDYTDEQGRVLYQVRRHNPKGFSVRSMTGKALAQGDRYRRIPYRVAELLGSDPSQTVYIVEGEKDVDRLFIEGLTATCNAFGGGRGKWTRGHSRFLRGRNVVILPDNDATGAEHGREVALRLHRVAKSVRVVNLPNLPPKGDVSDWFNAGHDSNDLAEIVAATPIWKPGRDRLPEPERPSDWEADYDALMRSRSVRRSIYGLPVTPTEKLMLLMLSEYRQPPQEELAGYLGVTSRRVRQMVLRLAAAGILTKHRRGRRNNYTINPEGGRPV